jgi:hypothetical protein
MHKIIIRIICLYGFETWFLAKGISCVVQNYLISRLCPSSRILNNWRTQNFENCICFLLQVKGMETPALLGPVERANCQLDQ